MKHCAEYNDQYCVCQTVVWAAQNDLCDYADKSSHHNRCMFQGDNERCDNPDICDELKGLKDGRKTEI
jgi:hypothetical protein